MFRYTQLIIRTPLVYTRWVPLLVVWLLLGSGCGAAPNTAEVQSSAATITSAAELLPEAAETAADAGLLPKPQGKLSATLAQLAQPEVASQPAAQQDAALALPASGPGSLLRNAQGEVLVAVRVGEASAAIEQALQATGATIVNSAPAFNTITLYISPERLNDLAALPGVENVREELRAS